MRAATLPTIGQATIAGFPRSQTIPGQAPPSPSARPIPGELREGGCAVLAGEFYEALVDGLPVDAALTEARLAAFSLPNWIEWATPVLFMRSPDGQIFDVSAAAWPVEPVAQEERESVAPGPASSKWGQSWWPRRHCLTSLPLPALSSWSWST